MYVGIPKLFLHTECLESEMWCAVLTYVLFFQNGLCSLWPKGVVHFAINKKDYDLHSQDVIMSTLGDIEREICVKFFSTPANYTSSSENRILYISNPDKRKDCPPATYNFNASVVDMPIGYKCIDPKNIGRIVVDMLRASVMHIAPIINSFDLIRTFQHMEEDPSRPFLLTASDRNFINENYHDECVLLSQRAPVDTRRSSDPQLGASMSEANKQYYEKKLWPLGILMYGIAGDLQKSHEHAAMIKKLHFAMMAIEMATCVVFRELRPDDGLRPKSLLWFGATGSEAPVFGFQEGNQTISLESMVRGAPGHNAHTLNLLLRALGMPMVSNRPDRDNHVTINWNNVEKGKEHYLEQFPKKGLLGDLPYDFESVTHAPTNFVCADCRHGETTVNPAQDHLWQRALSMGHFTALSRGDKHFLSLLYGAPCRERYIAREHN